MNGIRLLAWLEAGRRDRRRATINRSGGHLRVRRTLRLGRDDGAAGNSFGLPKKRQCGALIRRHCRLTSVFHPKLTLPACGSASDPKLTPVECPRTDRRPTCSMSPACGPAFAGARTSDGRHGQVHDQHARTKSERTIFTGRSSADLVSAFHRLRRQERASESLPGRVIAVV